MAVHRSENAGASPWHLMGSLSLDVNNDFLRDCWPMFPMDHSSARAETDSRAFRALVDDFDSPAVGSRLPTADFLVGWVNYGEDGVGTATEQRLAGARPLR